MHGSLVTSSLVCEKIGQREWGGLSDFIGMFLFPQEITSDAPYCLPDDEARKEQGNKENDDTIDSNFQP
jgi:hypothetical protein